MKRNFFFALLLSLLFHLAVIAAPGWNIGGLPGEESQPLEAMLRGNPPPPVKHAVRRARQEIAQAPAEVPQPVPVAQPVPPPAIEPAVPEQTAPPPEPPAPAVPEADKAVAAVPQAEQAAEAPDIAPPLPRSGRIRYLVTRGEGGFIIGQSIHEWRHDGKRYRMSAVMETTGIAAILKPVKLVQTSEGGFLKGELKPDSFRFDHGDNDIDTASFDWQARQITLGNGQVVAITDGAEDFLSMFYQLMQAAQRGEGFVMAVATGRKVERYAFEWLGEEELTLKPGHFHVWHVRVRATDGGKDTTEVWLGREAAGLPIKIRFTDRKGDVSEQVADDIEYQDK